MCSPHSCISARIQDGGHSAYGGHFDFLRTTIFSNNSPKSKCNTSKLVDFMPIKPIIWVLRQKNDNLTPGGVKNPNFDPK